MSNPAAGPGAWRVGDADRQAAVEALGEHYATGRLDRAEFDDRSERAWSARFEADLSGLFSDLPPPHGAVAAVPPQEATRSRPTGARAPGRPGRRLPVGPLVFAALVLAVVTHSLWILWLVPAFFWLVVRPMRRHPGWQHRSVHRFR